MKNNDFIIWKYLQFLVYIVLRLETVAWKNKYLKVLRKWVIFVFSWPNAVFFSKNTRVRRFTPTGLHVAYKQAFFNWRTWILSRVFISKIDHDFFHFIFATLNHDRNIIIMSYYDDAKTYWSFIFIYLQYTDFIDLTLRCSA